VLRLLVATLLQLLIGHFGLALSLLAGRLGLAGAPLGPHLPLGCSGPSAASRSSLTCSHRRGETVSLGCLLLAGLLQFGPAGGLLAAAFSCSEVLLLAGWLLLLDVVLFGAASCRLLADRKDNTPTGNTAT